MISMLKRFMIPASSRTEFTGAGNRRQEIKFALPGVMLSDARLAVALHPIGFRESYPPRQVNNVYFDSDDLVNLKMNEAGLSNRVKVRIRWYGELSRMASPVLELKFKSGTYGWKVQHPFGEDFDLTARSLTDLSREMQSRLPPSLSCFMDFSSRPVLISSYQREYYANVGGDVRATVDHQLRFFDQRLNFWPSLTQSFEPNVVVVELKALAGAETIVREVASQFGWRVSRNSKYVLGLGGY